MEDKELIEQIKQDVKSLDEKHNLIRGYWGRVSYKTVRVEQAGDSRFRVIVRAWGKVIDSETREADFAFWGRSRSREEIVCDLGIRDEEIGGVSFVIPRDYDIESLTHQLSGLNKG